VLFFSNCCKWLSLCESYLLDNILIRLQLYSVY
jgi:hypothetical protein